MAKTKTARKGTNGRTKQARKRRSKKDKQQMSALDALTKSIGEKIQRTVDASVNQLWAYVRNNQGNLNSGGCTGQIKHLLQLATSDAVQALGGISSLAARHEAEIQELKKQLRDERKVAAEAAGEIAKLRREKDEALAAAVPKEVPADERPPNPLDLAYWTIEATPRWEAEAFVADFRKYLEAHPQFVPQEKPAA